jgi:FkbM family methyltransferase
MRQALAKVLRRAGDLCQRLSARVYRSDLERQLDRWYRDDGDHTHRLRYDLTDRSVVIDVGGAHGQWASDIFAMYQPTLHILEPMRAFARGLQARFGRVPKIHVHAIGLDATDRQATLFLDDGASSMFIDAGRGSEQITLRRADDWLREQGIVAIDLLKIHTEGAEYDLVEHLIATGWIPRIRDLQVQFHDYPPDALARLERIRQTLRQTHDLTYQYPFLWENWRRR